MKFGARAEFSAATKTAAYERSGGHCEICTKPIRQGEGPHYDHIVPAAIGGSADLSNCQAVCKTCHANKTATIDVPEIARSKRLYKKRINTKQRRGPAMPGSKASKWKRKMNGQVVPR